jgi:hypothetical protein
VSCGVAEGYPYLSRRALMSGAGCRVGAPETAHPKAEPAGCRAQVESGARQACSRRSDGGELELAQGVEGLLADLAGDGQSGHGRVAPFARSSVEGEVGVGWPVRVHGGFDQRPAQVRRSGLRKMTAPTALARLVDDRIEAGQAGDLVGAAEAACLADLGEQVAGQDRPDPVDRLQGLAALVLAGEATQLGVDAVELRFRAAITDKSESTRCGCPNMLVCTMPPSAAPGAGVGSTSQGQPSWSR